MVAFLHFSHQRASDGIVKFNLGLFSFAFVAAIDHQSCFNRPYNLLYQARQHFAYLLVHNLINQDLISIQCRTVNACLLILNSHFLSQTAQALFALFCQFLSAISHSFFHEQRYLFFQQFLLFLDDLANNFLFNFQRQELCYLLLHQLFLLSDHFINDIVLQFEQVSFRLSFDLLLFLPTYLIFHNVDSLDIGITSGKWAVILDRKLITFFGVTFLLQFLEFAVDLLNVYLLDSLFVRTFENNVQILLRIDCDLIPIAVIVKELEIFRDNLENILAMSFKCREASFPSVEVNLLLIYNLGYH